jgi:hypothetical protein
MKVSKKEYLTAVGFEPTLRKEQQLECCVLDHSTKLPLMKRWSDKVESLSYLELKKLMKND